MPEANPLNSHGRTPQTLDDLLAELPEHWATIPGDQDGSEMAGALIRLAYGLGYSTALQNAVELGAGDRATD